MAPGLDPFLGSNLSRDALRSGVKAMASESRVVLTTGAVQFPLMCPNCGAPAQRTLEVRRALQTYVYNSDGPNETVHEIRSYPVPFCEHCIHRHFSAAAGASPWLPLKRMFGGDGAGEALGGTIVLLVGAFFLKEGILKLSPVLLGFAMLPGTIGSWLMYRNWRRNEHMSVAPASEVTSAVECTPNLSLDFEPAWRAFRFRNAGFAEQFRRLNAERIWDPQGEQAQQARSQRRRRSARTTAAVAAVVAVVLLWGLWSEYGQVVLDLIDRLQ